MPQASTQLREKFMTDNSDGISKAESVIREGNGFVQDGIIDYQGENPEVLDAIAFLIGERDYSWEV